MVLPYRHEIDGHDFGSHRTDTQPRGLAGVVQLRVHVDAKRRGGHVRDVDLSDLETTCIAVLLNAIQQRHQLHPHGDPAHKHDKQQHQQRKPTHPHVYLARAETNRGV